MVIDISGSSRKTYTRKVKEITRQNKTSGRTEKTEIFVGELNVQTFCWLETYNNCYCAIYYTAKL